MSLDELAYDAQFEDDVVDYEREIIEGEFENKRKMLEKTKIVKQTWSIFRNFSKN